MIGKKMREAMNEQIKHELESAYLYFSMAAYFHSEGLDGMAHWMRAQTQHEKFITGKIDGLVKLAAQEVDHAAGIFLHWFVSEQVEEESSTSKVAQLLERIGDSPHGLIMLDRELGTRSFITPPATMEGRAE